MPNLCGRRSHSFCHDLSQGPVTAHLGGAWHQTQSLDVFERISSRDGTKLYDLALCGPDDVDKAVTLGRAAFEDGRWRHCTPKAKKAVLHRLADLMSAHAETLALYECIDTSKPINDCRNVDIPLAINSVRYYAEALDKIYGEVAQTPSSRLAYCTHEPLGVIGAITPWNFPLHMAMWKVAPALAMGNSVILKPSELSSLTALYVAQLAIMAGLPKDVFQVITGLGEVAGSHLAHHLDVDMIAFTGSGRVGRALLKASADSNLKPISLELGGKSPQIVFADCQDLDRAANDAAWGVFYNQGQVCTAASRLLVESSIKDHFITKVIEVAKTIKIGDPYDPTTQFGAMISKRQFDSVLGHIEAAHNDGAKVLIGGKAHSDETGGYYIEPTILDGVARDSHCAREEIFGPVLSVLSFEDEADAVQLANDTVYGLGSGLWTANINRALRVSKQLKAGLVWVNGWDSCDMTSPFGGVKQSGFGRDRSLHALYKYADLKSVSISIGEA